MATTESSEVEAIWCAIAADHFSRHPAFADGLTESFWRAREEFEHIRIAARSAMVAPDALLGSVLARIAAFTPPSTCLPALVGDTVTLSLLVALIGETGDGKTSASNAARRLLPEVPGGVFTGSLGSGEGLIEAFHEVVDEDGPDGKKRKIKRQTRHGALFSLDEGRVLAEVGSRRGSIILPTLCSAWMGAEIGQANATIETKRSLSHGSYSVGLVSLWQPEHAARLLDDEAGGTPGRFLFLRTDDPSSPDDLPRWPGPLGWSEPSWAGEPSPLDVHTDIADELRQHRRAILRREVDVAPLDKHRQLLRLKVAGLLALLARRSSILPDDWSLAGMVLDASDEKRQSVVAAARRVAAQTEQASHDRAARREVTVRETVADKANKAMARAIANKVLRLAEAALGPANRREISRATKGQDRQAGNFEEAVDIAVTSGWIVQDGDGYRPGESRPA